MIASLWNQSHLEWLCRDLHVLPFDGQLLAIWWLTAFKYLNSNYCLWVSQSLPGIFLFSSSIMSEEFFSCSSISSQSWLQIKNKNFSSSSNYCTIISVVPPSWLKWSLDWTNNLGRGISKVESLQDQAGRDPVALQMRSVTGEWNNSWHNTNNTPGSDNKGSYGS